MMNEAMEEGGNNGEFVDHLLEEEEEEDDDDDDDEADAPQAQEAAEEPMPKDQDDLELEQDMMALDFELGFLYHPKILGWMTQISSLPCPIIGSQAKNERCSKR
jgi:hypothetical protein